MSGRVLQKRNDSNLLLLRVSLSHEAHMTSRLNPDDQQRVEEYLQASQHQVERKPFRPWMLLVVTVAVTVGLGLLSRLVSYLTL
jgi:Protein of unknown function (DUF3094)